MDTTKRRALGKGLEELFNNEVIKYHEIVVITLATYTFFTLTLSIISGIKYVRINEYTLIPAKIISLILYFIQQLYQIQEDAKMSLN